MQKFYIFLYYIPSFPAKRGVTPDDGRRYLDRLSIIDSHILFHVSVKQRGYVLLKPRNSYHHRTDLHPCLLLRVVIEDRVSLPSGLFQLCTLTHSLARKLFHFIFLEK